MIQRLHIRNYAIIDKVDINFSEKLNIITGETGAGKSIILGALGLIMGNRAEIRILKNQSKKCVIEAHFDILHYDLRTYFEEKDDNTSGFWFAKKCRFEGPHLFFCLPFPLAFLELY